MVETTTEIKNRSRTNTGGFEDPSAEFPYPNYWNASNINYAAKGQIRNDLWQGGADEGSPIEQEETVASQYYYNQVAETRSGHVMEFDDTPGNERVLIKHREGGGLELRQDGSVIISAPTNRVEVVGGEHTFIVEGDGTVVYKGNLNLKVTGDYNVECLNYNVNTKGNVNYNIAGAERKYVNGNVGVTVNGSMSTTATEQVTNTYLGGYSTNVKGTFQTNVEGSSNWYSSDDVHVTSEGRIDMSSDYANIVSENVSIIGGNGIIGGPSIHIKGQEASFEGSVEAPTFYGNLIGKAKFAALADKATGASTAGSLGGSGTANYPTDPGEPSFTEPTGAVVTTYLTKALGGIRKVKIDPGNWIMNYINRSVDYSGLSKSNLSVGQVRSKLRDQSNRSNKTFVAKLISEGVLNPQYDKPAPAGIGRTARKDAAVSTDGQSVDPSQAYIPKSGKASFIPEFRYNPYFNTPITTKTKLANGITFAKFLGTDDPTNLNFIRDQSIRTDIARYYYVHAQIMKTVQNHQGEFSSDRLLISEGLYRPGPSEKVTPGSLNDLKMKGRAVVYKLVDSTGKINNSRTFALAAYWIRTIVYDKIILSYDTTNPSGKYEARIIVIVPELNDNWGMDSINRDIETQFNQHVLSKNELVEALPFAVDTPTVPEPGANQGVTADVVDYGITLAPKRKIQGTNRWDVNPQIRRTPSTHPEVSSVALKNMETLLEVQYKLMQQFYGGPLTINDALPHRDTNRVTPSRGGGSVHWQGKALDISIANMTPADQNRLVSAAAKAGFKGFGFGRTILHVDLGRKRYWDYKQGVFAGRPVNEWYQWVDENVRG